MAYEHSIRRFRNVYRTLVRRYPKQYRERFGEPIEQTFNDLLQKRAEEEKGLFGFALCVFVETSAGIVRMCANLSWKLKRLQTPWFDGIGRNNIKPVRERSRDEESVTFGKETQEVACAG